MDKALFKAYVRELVKEEVEDAVAKILPKLLAEAIVEIKSSVPVNETASPRSTTHPTLDRSRLAELMGLEYPVAGGSGPSGDGKSTKIVNVPDEVERTNPAVAAINRDYSKLMKAMGI